MSSNVTDDGCCTCKATDAEMFGISFKTLTKSIVQYKHEC